MMEQAEELAKIMVTKNPLGLRMTKEAVNCNLDCAGLEAALNMEDRNQMMLAFSYHVKPVEDPEQRIKGKPGENIAQASAGQ